MIYCLIQCPLCGFDISLDWEGYQLAVQCEQLMCWEPCGMDVYAPAMYIFLNNRFVDDQWREEE